ncbi:MAG: hypothetical protein OEW30_09275, partial [Acidimicrobiia bacterium]|nr:hypothetical protein [Acidimicrobiia bacterium]
GRTSKEDWTSPADEARPRKERISAATPRPCDNQQCAGRWSDRTCRWSSPSLLDALALAVAFVSSVVALPTTVLLIALDFRDDDKSHHRTAHRVLDTG